METGCGHPFVTSWKNRKTMISYVRGFSQIYIYIVDDYHAIFINQSHADRCIFRFFVLTGLSHE